MHVAPRRQRGEAATGHPGVGTGQSTCCNVCCLSTLCCPAGTGYLGNVLVEQCIGVAEYVAQVIAQLGEISILYCALQRSVRFEQNLQIDHIILHTAQYNIWVKYSSVCNVHICSVNSIGVQVTKYSIFILHSNNIHCRMVPLSAQ